MIMQKTETNAPIVNVRDDCLPRSLVDLYRAYRDSNFEPREAFAYDTFTQWQQGVAAVVEYVTPLLHRLLTEDMRLAGQEVEFLDKMQVNWRYRGSKTLVIEPADVASHSCRNQAQALALTPFFKTIRKRSDALYVANEATESARLAPVRLDRGKGAPFWVPGTDPEGAIMLRSLVQRCRSAKEIEAVCRGITNPRTPVNVQTSYIRVQGSRTDTAKIRRIAAIGFVYNHWWAPYAEVLRRLMKTDHSGDVRDTLAVAGSWRYATAIDLKSYDTTVAYETHQALREYVILPLCRRIYADCSRAGVKGMVDPNGLSSIDELIITMGILTPSWNRLSSASIVPAVGQIRSGENPTSYKGTTINEARCRHKAQYLGARWGVDLITHNYGDDTILFCNDDRWIEAWTSEPSLLGFNEVVAADASFLMRRVPDGYGYLGRMITACINREPRMEPDCSLRLASSIATRRVILRGHPLSNHFIPSLRKYAATAPDRFKLALAITEDVPEGREIEFTQDVDRLLAGRANLSSRSSTMAEERNDDLNKLLTLTSLTASERSMLTEMFARRSREGVDPLTRSFLPWNELVEQANALNPRLVRKYLSKYVYRAFTS